MDIYDLIGLGCIAMEAIAYIVGKWKLRQELDKIDGFHGLISGEYANDPNIIGKV